MPTAAAEQVFKNSGKITENILKPLEGTRIKAARTTGTAHAFKARMTVLVIHLTFLVVNEDFIGLCGFLELVFRFLIAGIPVGMVLNCKFSVCFFYFVLVRGLQRAGKPR